MVFLFYFNGSTNLQYRSCHALKVERYSKILLKPSLLSALLSAYSDAHVSAIQPFPDDTVLGSCPQGKRRPANQLKRNDDLKRGPRTSLRFFCTSGKVHPPKARFPEDAAGMSRTFKQFQPVHSISNAL